MERLILCAWSVALIVGTVVLVGHEFNEIVGPIWRRFCRHRRYSAAALLEGMTVLSVALGLTRMVILATGTYATIAIVWPVAMLIALGAVLGCETIAGEAVAFLRRNARVQRQRQVKSGSADPLGRIVRIQTSNRGQPRL